MAWIAEIWNRLSQGNMPILLVLGLTIILGFYFGRSTKWVRLPSIIGYMVLGLLLGPSFLNLIPDSALDSLSVITEVALGFVAFSIGLELSMSSLKQQGFGIVSIILAESLGAFLAVFLTVLALTRDLPMALIFGALAPASAPAGTVAVIRELKAKGNLTRTLYAVVGFDDGLAIIIFGLAAALARALLMHSQASASPGIAKAVITPLKEIFLSGILGILIALVLTFLIRRVKNAPEVLTLVFGFIFLTIGICKAMHLSLILTNMIVGIIVVNTQHQSLLQKIEEQLSNVLPLVFVLFFALAGAHLHIRSLPACGLLGILYIVSRSTGLLAGARIGATIGHSEENVKKYTGLGILSQAGVAIGLALILKHEFSGLGEVVKTVNGHQVTTGDLIGMKAITTITATCIFFEIIGPICTKFALSKAGEIPDSK